MEKTVRFTKMHGAGNDYIYVDTAKYPIADPSAASIKWSDRHKGVGSDGLVLIDRSKVAEADFSMRIFNADGSEAMMCGNASRCIGKYLYERGLTDKTEIRLLTLSGVKVLKLHINSINKVESVTVDMLAPSLENYKQMVAPSADHIAQLTVDGRLFEGTFVSMGNPHFVIFTNEAETIDIAKWGAALECHPAFPERCNIEFAHQTDDHTLRTRVWERGSGITMACGTGACATAVAAAVTRRGGRHWTIVMDGGNLDILWDEHTNHVMMTGPAAFVCDGEIVLDE
ncbi:MAG: diaminopimelate epimerase [Prevotella sp.]|nr:diaminopimelate epimerase [Prevotellaceae bacterium]MDY4890011.1 diaminopimelate epimerase [Prevotella sp.]MDY5125468.1 diaminopimelate epimerase [Prevotella sp.]MDY5249962.1 diaminopimelate epimerase [Prevotella sp.]